MNEHTVAIAEVDTVAVYACGGAATNIVYALEKSCDANPPSQCFAKMRAYYLDGSRSNLLDKTGIDDRLFLIEGIDGSGKRRDQNFAMAAQHAPAMLRRCKPTTFNIIVHSGGGGTGSVIGPVLTKELHTKGHYTVSILIKTTDNEQELINTINTIKSYEGVAQKVGRTIPWRPVDGTSRKTADTSVKGTISMLMALFSGQNLELDSQDLKHFLDMTKICGIGPRAATLHISDNVSAFSNLPDTPSVATLVPLTLPSEQAEEMCRMPKKPTYHTIGRTRDADVGHQQSTTIRRPIHFVLSDGQVGKEIEPLEKELSEMREDKKALNARGAIVSSDQTDDDTGLVI